MVKKAAPKRTTTAAKERSVRKKMDAAAKIKLAFMEPDLVSLNQVGKSNVVEFVLVDLFKQDLTVLIAKDPFDSMIKTYLADQKNPPQRPKAPAKKAVKKRRK